MKYIDLFANGGLTKSEKSEGEQEAVQLLEDLQTLTGVDPNQATEILNQLYESDPKSITDVQNYIMQAKDPQSDEETRSNAITNLLKTFNPNMEESQYFKCGGKLQQLVTKFGKGGGVDCGCGGIKLDMGGPVKDGEYTRSDFFNELNEWTPVKLPNGDSGYARNYRKPLFRFGPSSNTLTQMLVTYDENGTPRASSREIKGFFNPNRVKLDTTYNTANNTSASKDFINRMNFALEGVAPERPQSKQEGGSIELTQLPGHDVNTTLTRRQARQLAMDKGRYANNAQFQSAMANAMNAARSMGLRGAEARQRAMEMVAGVSPAERNIVAPTQIAAATVAPEGFGNVKPIWSQDMNPAIISASQSKPSKPAVKPVKRGVVDVGPVSIVGTPSSVNTDRQGLNGSITPIERHGLKGTAYSFNSGKYGPDGLPLGFSSYQEVIPEQPNIVRTGRDDAGNYYEVTDGVRGVDTNDNLYIRTMSGIPSRNLYGNIVSAGRYFEQGGQIEKDITKTLKCGGKTKKK